MFPVAPAILQRGCVYPHLRNTALEKAHTHYYTTDHSFLWRVKLHLKSSAEHLSCLSVLSCSTANMWTLLLLLLISSAPKMILTRGK